MRRAARAVADIERDSMLYRSEQLQAKDKEEKVDMLLLDEITEKNAGESVG